MNPPTMHPAPNLKDCLSIACEVCGVAESDMFCRNHGTAPVVRARAMYVWLCLKLLDVEQTAIAAGIGKTSHGAVRHQEKWCEERMRVDPDYKRLVVKAMCGLVACRTLPNRAMEWLVWETAPATSLTAIKSAVC